MRALLDRMVKKGSDSAVPNTGVALPAPRRETVGSAPPPRSAPAAAPASPDLRLVESIEAANQPLSEPEGQQGARHFATFSDLPRFLNVITGSGAGGPIAKLSAADKQTVAVLELAGRKALVLTCQEAPPAAAMVESIRGALLSARYEVSLGGAARSVLGEIYAAHGQNEGTSVRGGVNAYMQTVHQWLEYAVENHATDIHLERLGAKGFVRMRIDGEMEAIRNAVNGVYSGEFVEKCMATLYNNEQQSKSGSASLFEPQKNLYCMVPYNEIPGTTLKLRYQSIAGNEGPKAILRLLHVNENARTLTFQDLGYERSQCDLWEQAQSTPSGAVLIAGVTGSGKSTTQKSFIELNPAAPVMSIYTVEDPVEYPIKYTHQIPIQRDLSKPDESSKKYADAITALMRGDLDVCMLGEVRDRPSATAMQQLTETGHMGLGTVHAHLLSGIVPRLCNPEIGMSREVITGPNMLTLLVYQALVPKLCLECALSTDEVLQQAPETTTIVDQLTALGLPVPEFRWKRQGGCSCCKSRGTNGLTVVAEMMMPTEEWLKPTREGRDPDAVEAYRSVSDGDLLSSNMDGKTVFEHTLYKAANGWVDARQCQRFDNFARFSRRYKQKSKVLV